jgi:soluble lytic murein transglycosylase-like protein
MQQWLTHHETRLHTLLLAVTFVAAMSGMIYGIRTAIDTDRTAEVAYQARYTPAYQPTTTKDLPAQLSSNDRARIRDALELQAKGRFVEADTLLATLRNPLLKGHVLAVRYLETDYRSQAPELKNWLENYADHPQAADINALLTRKSGIHRVKLDKSATQSLEGYGDSNGLSGRLEGRFGHVLNWSERPAGAQQRYQQILSLVQSGELARASSLTNEPSTAKLLKATEVDIALVLIANSHFYNGDTATAYGLARRATRSSASVPTAHWIAGLAAWKLKKTHEAAKHFAAYAAADDLSAWEQSAGSYWAFRSFDALNKPSEASKYLRLAATHPRTFYGVLARHQLHETLAVERAPEAAPSTAALQNPAVARSLALVEVGEADAAEAEIRALFARSPKQERPALLAVAYHLDLPAAQIRMARSLIDAEKKDIGYDYARYPTPTLMTKESYQLEPSLLYAFIREESGFNPDAKSPMGATGLMQIMPATARYVAEKQEIKLGKGALQDPETNLALGQSYIQELLKSPEVNNNLFFLAVAYNAGPGNLAKWQKNVDYKNDPLLFIESIPARETRNYVEQVMASYWIYRALAGKHPASAFAVAQGRWPHYEQMGIELAYHFKQ